MKYTFDKSPVNELVLGVQYEGPVFSINDEIAIYDMFKRDYPEITEVPPLPSIIENTDAPRSQRILTDWVSRKHFLSRKKDRLIQVQPDRLLLNWRKENQAYIYPRFEIVFDSFLEIVNAVDKRFDKRSAYNQYEMTYVDHIPLKSFDLEYYDIAEIFEIFKHTTAYKNFSINYSIPHETVGGVINASLKSAIRKDTKEKIIALESTCRGFLANLSLDQWFATAHELLLKHFLTVITEKAKAVWGYREE